MMFWLSLKSFKTFKNRQIYCYIATALTIDFFFFQLSAEAKVSEALPKASKVSHSLCSYLLHSS